MPLPKTFPKKDCASALLPVRKSVRRILTVIAAITAVGLLFQFAHAQQKLENQFDDDGPAFSASDIYTNSKPENPQSLDNDSRMPEGERLGEKPDVRKVRWLWSKEQVRQAEKIDLELGEYSGHECLKGTDTIAGATHRVYFVFLNDELVQISSYFPTSDGKTSLDLYQKLCKACRGKYGEAIDLFDELRKGLKRELTPTEWTAVTTMMLSTRSSHYQDTRTRVMVKEVDERPAGYGILYFPIFEEGKRKHEAFVAEKKKAEDASQIAKEKELSDKL